MSITPQWVLDKDKELLDAYFLLDERPALLKVCREMEHGGLPVPRVTVPVFLVPHGGGGINPSYDTLHYDRVQDRFVEIQARFTNWDPETGEDLPGFDSHVRTIPIPEGDGPYGSPELLTAQWILERVILRLEKWRLALSGLAGPEAKAIITASGETRKMLNYERARAGGGA